MESSAGSALDAQENDGRNSPLGNSGFSQGTRPPSQEGLGDTARGQQWPARGTEERWRRAVADHRLPSAHREASACAGGPAVCHLPREARPFPAADGPRRCPVPGRVETAAAAGAWPSPQKPTHVSLPLNAALQLRDGHVDVDDHVGGQVLPEGDVPHLVVVVHTWHTREAPPSADSTKGQRKPRARLSRVPGTAVGTGGPSDPVTAPRHPAGPEEPAALGGGSGTQGPAVRAQPGAAPCPGGAGRTADRTAPCGRSSSWKQVRVRASPGAAGLSTRFISQITTEAVELGRPGLTAANLIGHQPSHGSRWSDRKQTRSSSSQARARRPGRRGLSGRRRNPSPGHGPGPPRAPPLPRPPPHWPCGAPAAGPVPACHPAPG